MAEDFRSIKIEPNVFTIKTRLWYDIKYIVIIHRKYKDCVYGRWMLVQEYLKKWRIFKKVKPKNDLMHQNIDILSIMSNLQPNCCLKFDFQKVEQHAGGKWLIHNTKRRKDNQLQSLKLPCRISKLSS